MVEYAENNHRTNYHVTLTFDLVGNMDTGKYAKLSKALSEDLGLERNGYIAEEEIAQGRGSSFTCPSNTYVGTCEKTDTALSWRQWYAQQIQLIFRKYEVTSGFYLSVSENWSIGVHKCGW